MVEDTGSVIGKGFDTWKNNLTICIPFVLSSIITAIVAFIIIAATLLATIPSLLSLFTHPEELSAEFFPLLMSQIFQSIGIIIIAIIVTIILCGLINAFFYAGAIGMAKEATETGHTVISHMMEYGKRKFISLFFTDIILGLISFVGIVFLIPGILYIYPMVSAFPEPQMENMLTALGILGLGFLAMILYSLIISIIFALPRYAVVIDDLGAISGIKKGFEMFMRNKVAVFLIWLIVFVVSLIPTGFYAVQYVGWIIGAILSVIVVYPLTVIWWSRLYLSIIKPTEELGSCPNFAEKYI